MNDFPRLHAPLKPPERVLTFSPRAWLKLNYFCHAGATEIGGFGITAPGQDLYLEDFRTVRQETSAVGVCFHDQAVADFFDACVDQRLTPRRFARIWLHTHPSASVTPSPTDEETFAQSFGGCDWAVMFILGRTGRTYARLTFNAGPGGSLLLPVAVDWAAWPALACDLLKEVPAWQAEFTTNIHPEVDPFASFFGPIGPPACLDPAQVCGAAKPGRLVRKPDNHSSPFDLDEDSSVWPFDSASPSFDEDFLHDDPFF